MKILQVQNKILQVQNKILQVQNTILQVQNCHVTFGSVIPAADSHINAIMLRLKQNNGNG